MKDIFLLLVMSALCISGFKNYEYTQKLAQTQAQHDTKDLARLRETLTRAKQCVSTLRAENCQLAKDNRLMREQIGRGQTTDTAPDQPLLAKSRGFRRKRRTSTTTSTVHVR